MTFDLPLFETHSPLPQVFHLLPLFFLIFSGVSACAAQRSALDALATQVTQDVAASSRPSFGNPALSKPGSSKPALIVTDFPMLHGPTSRLGVELADRFTQALERQLSDVTLIPRDCLHQLIHREGIVGDDLSDFRALAWLAKNCGADLLIAGAVDDAGDHFLLFVYLLRATDGGRVQQRETILEKTPEMIALLAQPLHSAPSAPLEAGIPGAGEQGIGQPVCRICPSPSFTHELSIAMKEAEKKSLQMTFRVVVDESGEVSDIAVIKGAPYGATDQAIKTIRRWKLEPAKNADGRPVKAWTVVEVTYRQL